MNESHRTWLAWGILTLATLAISLFFGINYPVPPPPDEPPDYIELAANFSNPVDIEGSSSASAPALTFEDDTDTGFFRSAANTLNVASGGSEMLEIDSSGFTVSSTALDVDSSVDADVTSFAVDASGSIDLTSTEAAADAIHLDANGAVTTGIDIDLGSVSGLTVDGGLVDIGSGTCGVADGDNDVCIAAVLEVDGETELDGALDADSTSDFADTATFSKGSGTALDVSSGGELNVDGTLDINGVTNLVVGTEHIGVPTIHSTTITYTAAAGGSGTVATIGDGEIWFVHKVFVQTTTSFDCTGDDATLDIGDGNDADGFLALADGSIQSDFTEATGFAAGWAGIENGSAGAYTTDDGGPFVYAPSGSDETIDWLLDETSGESITAGAATIYVIYTRIQ